MLEYTKATLKAALTAWNRNSAPEFDDELDHIIQRGELALFRALDLDPLQDENDTTSTANSDEVFKPETLLRESDVWIVVDDERLPLLKRSRSWIKYIDQTAGTPLYYCERDDQRWNIAPPAADAYLIQVSGEYAPDSITDGDDNQTTWMSTKTPDLLYLACAIEACEFLKFWAHKAQLEASYAVAVAIYRGDTPNLQKTDPEDQLGNREQANPVKPPGA